VSGAPATGELRVAPWPQVNFEEFGQIEVRPMSRIQGLVSAYLARNWAMIPHVFHQDEADASELERVWRQHREIHPDAGITALAFLVKAVALTLLDHPEFNASLDTTGNALVLKKYVHIGVAVDTDAGLMVPVVRDCDKRPVDDIAADIARLAAKARDKGLALSEMSGGCFTVSSLGKTGGTAFTPIINAPELAILGVSRLNKKPHPTAQGGVEWRDCLPLSLGYDHRAINGAAAGAFMTTLRNRIEQPAELLSPHERA